MVRMKAAHLGAVACALVLALNACTTEDADGEAAAESQHSDEDLSSDEGSEDETEIDDQATQPQQALSGEWEDLARGGLPEGAEVLDIPEDYSALDGATAGVVNIAPILGPERFAKTLESCLLDHGAQVDYQDVGGDPTQLTAILESWLNSGVELAYNVGIDMPGQDQIIEQFQDSGVPFHLFGAEHPDGVVVLDANQDLTGRLIARWLVKELDGEGEVVMINANNGALITRETAIRDVFSDYPGIDLTVVGDPLGFSHEAGQEAAETAIQANPNISAFIGGFGALGIGAARAVESMGSDAIVVTADGGADEYESMREGSALRATVADPHEVLGGHAACAIGASLLAGDDLGIELGEPIFGTSVLVTQDSDDGWSTPPGPGEVEDTPRNYYQLR